MLWFLSSSPRSSSSSPSFYPVLPLRFSVSSYLVSPLVVLLYPVAALLCRWPPTYRLVWTFYLPALLPFHPDAHPSLSEFSNPIGTCFSSRLHHCFLKTSGKFFNIHIICPPNLALESNFFRDRPYVPSTVRTLIFALLCGLINFLRIFRLFCLASRPHTEPCSSPLPCTVRSSHTLNVLYAAHFFTCKVERKLVTLFYPLTALLSTCLLYVQPVYIYSLLYIRPVICSTRFLNFSTICTVPSGVT